MLTCEKYLYPCLLVQKSLELIHLRALTQLSNQPIAQLAGVHPDTVTDYIRCYNQQGLAVLKAVGYQGPSSLQDAFQKTSPE